MIKKLERNAQRHATEKSDSDVKRLKGGVQLKLNALDNERSEFSGRPPVELHFDMGKGS